MLSESRRATSPCAYDFDLKIFTVQSRLENANNHDFDWSFNHRAAAIARMKTNFVKDKISIQFEGEPCSCTPRNLQFVVDLVCCMDRTNSFTSTFRLLFEVLTMRLLRFTKIRASPHRTLFSFFIQYKRPVLLPSSPSSKCSFVRMVFQCKCVVLSDLFSCPSMLRQIREILCDLQPSFDHSLEVCL